jgi:hypothetical protein
MITLAMLYNIHQEIQVCGIFCGGLAKSAVHKRKHLYEFEEFHIRHRLVSMF